MRSLALHPVQRPRLGAAPYGYARPPLRPRTRRVAPVRAVLVEDPYRTLGVSSNADEREIKRAYRRLALKYHPDVNQTSEAEHRFVSIQAAYEILTGKRKHATSGVHTSNQHNDWEFQNWFWSFSASRRWSAQQHARPPQDQARAPQEPAVLHTQLAGLRQRAAIRHTKKSREGASSAAAAAADTASTAADATAASHQSPSAVDADASEQEQEQQQQHHATSGGWRPPPPLTHVEYDSTAMSDGVNMANGVGYDPWSAEVAAAARRPRFTATDSVKSQVVGQLGGLKRRAAVKREHDATEASGHSQHQAQNGSSSAAADVTAQHAAGFTAVEDDPWSI